MKVIIAGGRRFSNYEYLRKECDKILDTEKDVEIVSGGANGADALGERYARERGLPISIFKADWEKYGRSAGPKRNNQMAEYADALIVFWNGTSRGSMDMIAKAAVLNLQIEVRIYRPILSEEGPKIDKSAGIKGILKKSSDG